MLKVVSNSSPIIHLTKMGYAHLLENLYKKIYITDYVYEECTGEYIGTIGVLLKAREIGLIHDNVQDLLKNLKSTGFYVSKKLEENILESC